MLSKDDILLLYQIERHCADCIRACMYARTFNETGRNLWIFTHNCYAEIAILRWCKVFGSYKEQTHYKHFFKKCFSIPNCSKLTYDQVKSRLISATRMRKKNIKSFGKT